MKERNSLIELYRFIFAMNVVKGHGYFPINLSYFGPARISVEFFFVLSGYLLLRSIDKFGDNGYLRGTVKFLLSKLKPLAIPMIIALPFNVLYKIVAEDYSLDIFGYLWYVRDMLICFAVFYILNRLINNKRLFGLTVAFIFAVCTAFHVHSFFYSWGIFRAGMGISCGILLSYIPKIQIKHQWLLWLATAPLFVSAMWVMAFYLADQLWIEMVLDLIIYPFLIYFSFSLPVRIRLFNYLGALSFGLYAFQCVVRPLEIMGVTSKPMLFVIICALALAEDAAKRFIAIRRRRT